LWQKFGTNPVKQSPEFTSKNIRDIPILIVHGDKDSQTELYQAKKLFENCSSYSCEIWIVEGKDHLIEEEVLNKNSSYYRERIIKFLDNNFTK